jgi:hypothetical protein
MSFSNHEQQCAAQRKYNHSPKGRAAYGRYNKSERAHVAARKYRHSEKGKTTKLKYMSAYTALPEVKVAMRESYLKRKYGISISDYQQMLARQNGCCAVCSRQASAEAHGVLRIDHDHKTMTVRGLLCHSCNVALGHGRDNPIRLRELADYLERGSE